MFRFIASQPALARSRCGISMYLDPDVFKSHEVNLSANFEKPLRLSSCDDFDLTVLVIYAVGLHVSDDQIILLTPKCRLSDRCLPLYAVCVKIA